jgi:hypothetical protein
VLHDDPKDYDGVEPGDASGKRRDEIERAAAVLLRAVKSIVRFDLNLPSQAGGTDDRKRFAADDLVRVRLQATYRCQVPLASRLVCGFLTGRRVLTGEAALPNHGATYQYATGSPIASP